MKEDLTFYYQQTINALFEEHDWKAICISIAKRHPKIFIEALDEIPWKVEAKRIGQQQGKIHAIKFIREQTGLGLNEAKEEIERLTEEDRECGG